MISLRAALLLLALPACGSVASGAEPIAFRREVMAVISKAGCNLGACHGNGNGKGGLKLSLRGQDPDLDWLALTRDQGGRRVNVVEPEKSLLLLKATAGVAHEGGKRFAAGSPEYQVMLEWLQSGATDSAPSAGKLKKLTVTPRDRILIAPATEVQLSAIATFADGAERDVTRFAVFEPNNQAAQVTPDGLVKPGSPAKPRCSCATSISKSPCTSPSCPRARASRGKTSRPPTSSTSRSSPNSAALRTNPSELCNDEVFLRRAFLDLLGLVPTAEEARAFLADPAPDKRAQLVEHLLQREEFADFWALKWADLLKIEERQLDKEGMQRFPRLDPRKPCAKTPLDEFARDIIAARGSTFQNPPANWWRANRDPVTRAENTARVFLGTQLNCAQCHNHPFERWTQDDYYNWTALFARVDYKLSDQKGTDKNDKQEFSGDQTVLIKASGSVINPRTGDKAAPRFLGGETPQITKDRDELLALADWLVKSPMFARTQVNRIWFHLLGRGLVDPVDDFRASNPPSHPELLELLAKDFAGHNFDLRHLISTITASRTYQLSAVPNETNGDDETNFSRALVRRLTAEQLARFRQRRARGPAEDRRPARRHAPRASPGGPQALPAARRRGGPLRRQLRQAAAPDRLGLRTHRTTSPYPKPSSSSAAPSCKGSSPATAIASISSSKPKKPRASSSKPFSGTRSPALPASARPSASPSTSRAAPANARPRKTSRGPCSTRRSSSSANNSPKCPFPVPALTARASRAGTPSRSAASACSASLSPACSAAKLAAIAKIKARAKSVIFLFQWGGPSHLDMFDMKPDAPEGIRGPHKPISSKRRRHPGLRASAEDRAGSWTR